ncbi:nucleophosmin-like isoform X2 [Hemiscyllium ocellatum]|uniref:nucleophosmin-like isoform X2 n=1 Tax=Hemiscyllium ocellatum TaxID=170820 RepID=UPI0029676FA1|nr:nucleophosmin-like isoform X2 [Hemiscyllium ocellatum]
MIHFQVGLEQTHGSTGVEIGLVQYLAASVASAFARSTEDSGCELKTGHKEYKMEVEDDDSEHQLSLRTICLGVGASDDLHLVEAEGLSSDGKNTKVTLAALKLSIQPTVSLGGFEMAPPVTFRLKSGTGPVHISGQHLIALEDDDLESDVEDDSILETTTPKQAVKRPTAAAASKIMPKKMKVEDSDEDDEEEEDDDDDDDEGEDEKVVTPAKKPLQKIPLKATPGLKGTPNQNGKTPTKSTPENKQSKTPESSSKPKTPKTPKAPLTIEEIKTKLKTFLEKGVSLPKLEPKFVNFLKNGLRVEDPKMIKDLWTWRQTLDGK